MREYERYQPKGSMCMACTRAREDCSKFDFKAMPMMFSVGTIAIVRCQSFVADSKTGNQS